MPNKFIFDTIKLYKYIPFFILILLCTCKSNTHHDQVIPIKKKFIRLTDAKNINEIFIEVNNTQLSTNSECLISDISDMEIDANGNFIIADGWQSRDVFIFASEGFFLQNLGNKGQGPGEYSTPVSIEVGNNKNIYLADYLANRINIYNKSYKFVRSISPKKRIDYYIHLNSKNQIYMYSSEGSPREKFNTIRRYDDLGNIEKSFAIFPFKAIDIDFSAIQDGMAIDNENNIYEMNPLYYQIRKFSADGILLKVFPKNNLNIIKANKRASLTGNGPYFLESGLIIVQIEKRIDIYDIYGNFIVGNIPLPQRIISSYKNNIYLESWSEKDKKNLYPNPRIICLELLIN